MGKASRTSCLATAGQLAAERRRMFASHVTAMAASYTLMLQRRWLDFLRERVEKLKEGHA